MTLPVFKCPPNALIVAFDSLCQVLIVGPGSTVIQHVLTGETEVIESDMKVEYHGHRWVSK
jgi:hypothetical protein